MTQSNALVPVTPQRLPVELTKRELAESRLYPNIKTPAQAAVVIAKARSYGLDPTTVADGLYFVGGKPALSAQLIATLLKRSGKYDFRVIEKTDKQCTIDFFERIDGKREKIGRETFTMVMAVRAELAKGVNWKKFPEAMLWARCLTAGVRAHCPDALGGNPVYSVEELRPETEVDAEGRPIIEAEVVSESSTSETVSPPAESLVDTLRELISSTNTDESRLLAYYKVESLDQLDNASINHAIGLLNEKKRKG